MSYTKNSPSNYYTDLLTVDETFIVVVVASVGVFSVLVLSRRTCRDMSLRVLSHNGRSKTLVHLDGTADYGVSFFSSGGVCRVSKLVPN